MTKPSSVRSGETPDKRLILETTSAPTPDPTNADKGWSVDGSDYIHFYFELTGDATAATVTPWYWSEIAGQWFESNQLSVTSTNKFGTEEIRGVGNKVFLVVDSLTVTVSGGIKCWAATVFDGRSY